MLALPAAHAQQETRLWYFGANAGLNFNVPPATPTSPAEITTNAMNTIEGSAVTSDRTTGALLFYTNGINAWDRNNTPMPGSGTPMAGGPSSTQAGLTVPDPGNPNRYYIFTTPDLGTGPGQYNIVDMTQRGGLGNIVLERQPLPTIGGTAPPLLVAEKLAASPDATGTGYWVVFSEYVTTGSTSRYFSYHVSAAGIDRVVVSSGGVAIRGVGGARARGELKFSPNGQWVAAAHEDTVITLHSFNRATGVLSFVTDLGNGPAYGVSFSPNSNLLYVNDGWNLTPGHVFQFNLSSGNPATIRASRIQIGTSAEGQLGGMQIAPDGRIYIAQNGAPTLSAINCPDNPGLASGFVENAFTFTGSRRSTWGLPNLILESVATPDYGGSDTTICGPQRFRIGSAARAGYTYSWTPATGLDDPNIAQPMLNATATGKFYVTVTNAFNCSVVDSVTVTVNPLPSVTAPRDTSLCLGSSIRLVPTAAAGLTYLWQPATGLDDPTSATPIASPLVTTTYRVVVSTSAGCRDTDDVVVTVNPLPSVTAGTDRVICVDESVQLTANGSAGVTYLWEPAIGLDNPNIARPMASPVTTTVYRVIVTNGSGCRDTAQQTVTVNPRPVAVVRPDTALCAGASVQLQVTGGTSVVWEPATGLDNPTSATPIATPTATTTYQVIVSNSNGCRDTGTVTITVNPLPVATATASADTICASESTTLTASGGTIYTWSPVTGLSNPTSATTTATPAATTTYRVIVENATGCLDTAFRTVTVLTPSVSFSIPDTVGDPHTRGYRIPIRIGSPVNVARCSPDGVTISLLFNASLFNPTGVSRGTMTKAVEAGGMRRVRITITDPAAFNQPGVLVELIGDVLLGNATTTPLVIDSVEWSGLPATASIRNGSLGIFPYCMAGGPRLLNNPNGFGLRVVSPNPASDRITVTARSAEVGETRLEIYSTAGELVHSVTWDTGDNFPGMTEERDIELPRSLPSGVYQIVLRSPSWSDAQTLIITK
jgi:hypothetical protein